MLNETLEAEQATRVIEISEQDEPFVDSYGRATYFIIQVGDQPIPIY
jgi:hypothetical protein